MATQVEVTVYELRWPGTDEVYVGSTSGKLSDRLARHRNRPCACYKHLPVAKAQIVPVHTYTTSARCNRQPEAAHKALLRKQNRKVLVDANDQHNQVLWHTTKTKARLSAVQKGKRKGPQNHTYAPFQVTFPDGTVVPWETTIEAATAYGVSQPSISRYLNGVSTPGGNKRTAHLRDTTWQYV